MFGRIQPTFDYHDTFFYHRNVRMDRKLMFYDAVYHCRVPEKEWSFQDGGRASLFKVGLVV
jgi:hypothetical protein